MNILKGLFTIDKDKYLNNYIWYNDDLKKCCWGSLEKFEAEQRNSTNKDSCKLICKPEVDSKNCKEIVEEINSKFKEENPANHYYHKVQL